MKVTVFGWLRANGGETLRSACREYRDAQRAIQQLGRVRNTLDSYGVELHSDAWVRLRGDEDAAGNAMSVATCAIAGGVTRLTEMMLADGSDSDAVQVVQTLLRGAIQQCMGELAK